MEQWLRTKFETRIEDEQEKVKVRDDPETWAPLAWVVNTFADAGPTPSRESLRPVEKETGWGMIFDEWKSRGLID